MHEQGGGPGSHSLSHSAPVPNKPYGFCGRNAPWKKYSLPIELGSCENREVGQDSHSLSHSSPVPNKLYGLCGRKAPRKKGLAESIKLKYLNGEHRIFAPTNLEISGKQQTLSSSRS